jgi:hypothetical protein
MFRACARAAAAASCFVFVASVSAATFLDGGNRLAATQNNDGGWDWPLNDGNANTGSQPNTIGPIGRGLIEAANQSGGSPAQSAPIAKVGNFLLGKSNTFSPSDGYLAVALDDYYGGSTYSTHLTNNYYAPLAAGTYNLNGLGTLYNTASYVAAIRASRTGVNANLGAYDLGVGLYAAAKIGATTGDWITGLKAEVNELSAGDYYDVLGLATGVLGLSAANEAFDPTSGSFASANSVSDLAAQLTTYQLSDGSFTWLTSELSLGNDSAQETAYAILALNEANRAGYYSVLENAADFLKGAQLPSGGWENYAGDGENNQTTGEAMWSIGTVPEPTGLAILGLAGFAMRRARRCR